MTSKSPPPTTSSSRPAQDPLNTQPRVVIADDSAIMRAMITDLLEEHGCEIVAKASNGLEAVDACRGLKPDVLTLDLMMPGLDGLGVLEQLADSGLNTRVVVVSSFSTSLVDRAMDVLDHGATDVVRKPSAGISFGDFNRDLADKVMIAANAHLIPDSHPASSMTIAPASGIASPPREPVTAGRAAPAAADDVEAAGGGQRRPSSITVGSNKVLVIAASTGGPRALGEMVPDLPLPIGAGAVIVQHMPPGFTASLARRLDALTDLTVREAVDGDRLSPNTILIARSGSHLRFKPDGTAWYSSEPPIGGVRPRADVTIEDLVAIHGKRMVLAVLTGMGRDGTDGARRVHDAGGTVLAQDEEDCVVYGMPRHVAQAGLADRVVLLNAMPGALARALKR